MANIVIQENGTARTRSAVYGEELIIKAPCNSSDVTGVKIVDTVYPLYDSAGNNIGNFSELFVEGSLIKVLIDTENTRAILETLPAKTPIYSCTLLSSSWEGTGDTGYTQIVAVEGILSIDSPVVDIVLSGTFSTDKDIIDAWGAVYRVMTNDGSITAYATEVPSVDINIQLKAVR